MSEMNNPKLQRREDAKLLRNALPEEFRQSASEKICSRITSMASFGLCDIVLCYSPIGSEVDVLPIARAALRRGKTVAFPVCDGDEMEFYKVNDPSELTETNHFGVLEPVAKEENLIVPTKTTMILMPGLLFDTHGKRIGYGGGYYDKYIRRYPDLLHSSMTVGVTYSAFLSDIPIPYTDLDISAAIVVTEKKLHLARKVEKAPKWEVRKRRYVPLIDAGGNPVEKKKREFYNSNYVSPDEGTYKKPKAKDIVK